MIKIKTGTSLGGTNESAVGSKEIIIPVSSPLSLKDVLIGGGMALMGIAYLAYTAYSNGAKAYERAEMYTMVDCGIIDAGAVELLDRDSWKWSLK